MSENPQENPNEVKKYSCPNCKYFTSNQDELTKHLQSHSGEKASVLKVSESKLDNTVETNPVASTSPNVSSVDTLRTNTQLTKPKQTHPENKVSCPNCEYFTSNQDELTKHLQSHSGDKASVLKVSESKLDNTVETNPVASTSRNVSSVDSLRTNTQLTKPEQTHPENKVSCPNCEYFTSNQDELTKHLQSHSGDKASVLKVSESKLDSTVETNPVASTSRNVSSVDSLRTNTQLTKPKQTHPENKASCSSGTSLAPGETKCNQSVRKKTKYGEKAFRCDKCGMLFHRRFRLEEHMRIHTEEKPFECEKCSKRYALKYLLIRHHLIMHPGEYPFQCMECHKGFLNKHVLTTHTHIHTRERPYVCDICTDEFNSPTTFEIHLQEHDIKRDYICKIVMKKPHSGYLPIVCGASFTNIHEFIIHKRSHPLEKPDTTEKLHRCFLCENVFQNESSLQFHMQSHKEDKKLSSEECNVTLPKQAELNEHRSDSSFPCEVCDESFVNRSLWQKHLRNHLKVEHFICIKCGSAFQHTRLFKNILESGHVEKLHRCEICTSLFYHMRHLVRHRTQAHPDMEPYAEETNYSSSSKESESTTYLYCCKICDQLFPDEYPSAKYETKI